MKTVTALPAPALSHKPGVKRFLIRVVIYLTSDKFTIFVGVIAALMAYIGVLLDDNCLTVSGAITFLAGFSARAVRETARDIRQDKLGINNDKW